MLKGNLFFSSDWHFFHENIMEYCHRKFRNTSNMHHVIIKNVNNIVNKDDTLIIAGDLTMKGYDFIHPLTKLLSQIKCKNKILVLGNHDKLQMKQYLEIGFTSIHSMLEIPEYDITVIHDPALALNKNRLYVCGHVHNLFITCNNCVNVGVDVHNFKPVSIDSVKELAPAYFSLS